VPSGLPPYIVAAVAAFVLVVIGASALWFRWLLRASRRPRLTTLRAIPLATVAILAAAPWLYVTLTHVNVSINVDGNWELALLVAEILGVYVLWILWPATYAVVACVWLAARLRSRQQSRRPTAPQQSGDGNR
jgi:hypothetical protein